MISIKKKMKGNEILEHISRNAVFILIFINLIFLSEC